MPIQIIPKPAVKRTQRVIAVPKTVRTVLKPDTVALQKIQQQAVKPKRVVQVQKKERIVGRKPNAPRVRQAVVQQTKQRPRRSGPAIRYNNKDVSELSKKKIREIHNAGSGKVLLIIGNGPSIKEVELQKLRGHNKIDMMSINKPDSRLWPTEYWLFCDTSQYKRHEDLWTDYSGHIINTTAIRHQKPNSLQVKNIDGVGFSKDLVKGFYVGRSSVYAAMQVGLWLNYDHIYIFGCDMAAVKIDGKEMLHFYGVNPDVKPKNRAARFDNEAKHYRHAANDLPDAIRSRFTFCSIYNKYDFVNKFNRMDHRKAVEKILESLDGQKEAAQEP
jgi:hypothetical protein